MCVYVYNLSSAKGQLIIKPPIRREDIFLWAKSQGGVNSIAIGVLFLGADCTFNNEMSFFILYTLPGKIICGSWIVESINIFELIFAMCSNSSAKFS